MMRPIAPFRWILATAFAVVGGAVSAQIAMPSWTKVWPAGTDTLEQGDTLSLRWGPPVSTSISYGIEDLLVLRSDDPTRPITAGPMDVHVRLRVKATTNPDHGDYDKGLDKDTLLLLDFHIGARGVQLSVPGLDSLLDDQDADARLFLNAHKLHLEVDTIEADTGTGYHALSALPKGLFFDLRMTWSHAALLDLTEAPEDLGSALYSCHVSPPDPHELEFHWALMPDVVEYDVEWSWVDDYKSTGGLDLVLSGTPLTAAQVSYDLGRSATRVTTTALHYRIPLLYDRGWIVWRVRGVGRDPVHTDVPVHTHWNGAPTSGTVQAALTLDPEFAVHVPGHQRTKNWQATSAYAEEGKHKEVVTYADGSTRARQVVTRNNTWQVPIIGETIYDVVGRPAIQVMPVPLVNEGCNDIVDEPWAPIEYKPNFNQRDNAGTAEAFTWSDLSAGDGCGISAPTMHQASGAEHYYSEDQLGDTDPLVPPSPFLPKAEGYPYSQTEYTRDNTGRIRAQGGVGAEFQLGGHDTRYFYGKPEQIELDRLFGSEAGYAQHYQKLVQQDPNGQVTVTYQDMAGRTIATALSCSAPTGMDEVGASAVALTTDLFNGLPGTAPALHQARPEGPQLFFSTQIAVPCSGAYTFTYKVRALRLQDACWSDTGAEPSVGLCAHCVYDLDIILSDACGVPVEGGTVLNALVGTLDLDDEGVMFACTDQEEQTFTLAPADPLPPGEYTLTKVLRVHQAARDYYVQAFLADSNNTCVLDSAHFATQVSAGMSEADCTLDCADCYTALGTLEAFITTHAGTAEQYYQLLAECDELCKVHSWCDVAYQNMLADVSPHGQYCTFELGVDQSFHVSERTSVLYFAPGLRSILLEPFRSYAGTLDWRSGVDPDVPLWRQPLLERNGTHVAEYRDLSGVRTTVPVFPDGLGGYDPAVEENSLVFEENGSLYTWPENLTALDDFLHHWQPGWERSLVRFHPEYCYYMDCRGYAAQQEGYTFTSDAFDGRLQKNLEVEHPFADAVTQGLLTTSLSSPYATFGFQTLDPFADVALYGDYAQDLIDRYNAYLTIGGVPYSMPQAAAAYARCAGVFTGPGCLDFGDPAAGTAVLDEEWRTLNAFYASEKYAIQKKRGDAYVSTCECSSLNHCIGEDDTQTWWNKLHSPVAYNGNWWLPFAYDDWYANAVQQWLDQPSHRGCQACNDWTYQFFTDKVRRVQEPSQLPGSDLSPMEAAYQQYLATGQCPVATAWQGLFQQLVDLDELHDADHLDLSTLTGWTSIGLALTDFLPGTTAPAATITSAVSSTDLFLTISYADARPDCVIQLLGGGIDWASIDFVAGITATGPTEFTLTVYYTDGTGQHVAEIGGKNMCHALMPCNFPRQCEPNELAREFQSLFNMLAQRDKLDSPTDADLSIIGVPGVPGTTPSIHSVVGPAIMARFGITPVSKWKYTGGILYLSGGGVARYRIDDLSTEPATYSVAAYLALAGHFENITSAYENRFEVDVYTSTGAFLCRLKGRLWWEQGGGSTPLSMGSCGLPPSLSCQGAEYDLLRDLVAVIEDRMVTTSPSFGDLTKDLWWSPYMTPLLAGALCPTCDADWKLDGVPGLEGKRMEGSKEIGFGCLTIGGLPSLSDPITHVGEPIFTDVAVDGVHHNFDLPLYENGSQVGVLHIKAPCLDLRDCDPCPREEEEIPLALRWGGASDSLLVEQGVLYLDTLWEGYKAYVLALDSMNGRLGLLAGDSTYVPPVSYPLYRERGYQHTLGTYLRYIRQFQPRVDRWAYLQEPDSFIVAYGHAVNVKGEHRRYARAVADYNVRAEAASRPGMPIVPDSTFAELAVADSIAPYVDALLELAPQALVPDGLAQHFAPVDTTDACTRAYLYDYLPAYRWFEEHNADSAARCPQYALYTPLYSLEEFRQSNLCCSDTGLAVLAGYLALLRADTGRCPGALPLLKTCPESTPMMALMLSTEDCQRLYTIWANEVKNYPFSSYYANTHNPLPETFKTFQSFVDAGMCLCVEDYLDYLKDYIDWSVGKPLPPDPPVTIAVFCDGGECCGLFDAWKAIRDGFVATDYNDSTGIAISIPYERCDQLLASGFCRCLPAYLDYLQTYVDWHAPMPLPPPPVSLSVFCAPTELPTDEPCSGSYEAYVDGLTALQPLLDSVNTHFGSGEKFYFATEELFTSTGLCYCVEGYLAFVRSSLEHALDMDDVELLKPEEIFSILRYCTEPVPCPPPPLYPVIPTIAVEEECPCCADMQANIDVNTQSLYRQYLDTLVRDLTFRYDSTCLSVLETLRMAFTNNEHHYTLYYYDQAGNLVRTVPPEGVEPLAITAPGDAEALAIAADRAAGTHTVLTTHRMPSDHVYNSLDQPVRMAMPDQDNMDLWRTTLPDGLPGRLQITGSWFGAGGRGYLTGFRDAGTVKRGYVYTTDDGGLSWQRSIGLLGNDLRDVLFPVSSSGYAVGPGGTFIRSGDGGASWDLVPRELLRDGGDLTALSFVPGSDDGLVVGRNGYYAFTADGGDGFNPFTLGSHPHFTGVGYNGSVHVASAVRNDGSGGEAEVGLVLTVPPGGSWSSVDRGATDASLTCGSVNGATPAWLGGTTGVLLKSTDGDKWATVRTRTTDDFRRVWFKNADRGVALMDSIVGPTTFGVLRYTWDGGRHWTPIGHPEHDYADLFAYQPSGANAELVAVGKRGLVVRVLLYADTVSILPLEGLPVSVDLVSVWAGKDGTKWRCLAGSQAGEVYATPDLQAGLVLSWSSTTPQSGHTMKRIAGHATTDVVRAVMLNELGRRVDLRWQLAATPTFAATVTTPGTDTWTAIAPVGSGIVGAYRSTDQTYVRVDLTTGAPPFASTAITPTSGTPPDPGTVPRVLFQYAGNKVVFGGDKGGLYNGDGTLPTFGWTDHRTTIQPLPLRAIDRGGRVAVGEQGTFFYDRGSSWSAHPTLHLQTLRAVSIGTTTVAVAGDEGVLFTFPLAAPNSIADKPSPLPVDLTAVWTDDTQLIVGTAASTLFRTADITVGTPAFSEMPFNGGAVRALAPRPSSTEHFAVGADALMHRLIGTTRQPITEVFTPELMAVGFADADPGNGYVVGAHRVVRRTTDGGLHWQALDNTWSALPLPGLSAVRTTAPGRAWAVGPAGKAFRFEDAATFNESTPFSGVDLTAIAIAPSGAAVIAGIQGANGKYFRRNAGGAFTGPYGGGLPKLYTVWNFPRFAGTDEFVVGGDNSCARRLAFPGGTFTGPEVNADLPTSGAGPLHVRAFWFHDHVSGLAVGTDGRLCHLARTTTPDHLTFAWDAVTSNQLNDGLNGQGTASQVEPVTVGFSSRHTGFIGGVYTSAPATCYARTVHDESGLYAQRLWYDALGRVILSQNTKQFNAQRYSYSLYDALGRVYEAGELDDTGDSFRDIPGAEVNGQWQPSVLDPEAVKAWVNGNPDRRQVVRTWYDAPLAAAIEDQFTGDVQRNLRLRVASTTYQETYHANPRLYDHATHYSYDIHGNVAELVQDHPHLAEDLAGDSADASRFLRTRYRYDLISGNVQQVDYQNGHYDQMHHRYSYDADNRITQVETSVDGHLWYPDATYFYYAHGPLERVELGRQVQGMDYAYTLQGWLKGINSDLLLPERDMGRDGVDDGGNPHRLFGRDAYGLSLGYHGADYEPIDAAHWTTVADRPFAAHAWDDSDGWNPLYNGNIAHTVNSLEPFGGWTSGAQTGQALAQVYRYDQLNRLKVARGYDGLTTANDWASATPSAADLYKSMYAYDANGNITQAKRYDQDGALYDSLYYHYQNTGGELTRNRLYQLRDLQANDALVNTTDDGVEDLPGATATLTDPDGSLNTINTANNYGYDALGQLVRDTREEIATIDWTVAGKVAAVHRTIGSTREELAFHYGAAGQRISKEVGNAGVDGHREHYVRDAQGNIMATYRYAPGTFLVMERPMYGSKRVGTYARSYELMGAGLLPFPYTQTMSTAKERFELTDHLGNVATVVTGRLLDGNGAGSVNQAEVVNAKGYEPFGSLLPGRNYNLGSYRHLFQGQEHDDEVNDGVGLSYAFEYRMHDPRVGRFLSIDPLAAKYPHNSPYAFSENRVVDYIELEGLEGVPNGFGVGRGLFQRGSGSLLEERLELQRMRERDLLREPARPTRLPRQSTPEEFEEMFAHNRTMNEPVIRVMNSARVRSQVQDFETKYEGTRNEVRTGNVEGREFQINSGHAYNREHKSGSFENTNASQLEIETGIVSNLLEVPLSSIPEARVPFRPYEGVTMVNGVAVGYTATQTNGRINVSNYFPVTSASSGSASGTGSSPSGIGTQYPPPDNKLPVIKDGE